MECPARNPSFTGWAGELAALGSALASGAAVTVRGMGGVGKSQLATEHAYARAGDYDLVYWIAAEEPAAVPDHFAALARQLGLEGPPDPDSLRELVHARLREVPGWLLIFDNADDAEDLRSWIPAGPRPPGIPGHVLITTRRRGGFSALGQVLELDVMPVGDAGHLAASPRPRHRRRDRYPARRGARAPAAGAGAGRRLPGPDRDGPGRVPGTAAVTVDFKAKATWERSHSESSSGAQR